jgi:hypothetical protein
MSLLMTTVTLPQTYCPSCHLSTRSDVARCLHCNKLLQPPRNTSRSGERLRKTRLRSR